MVVDCYRTTYQSVKEYAMGKNSKWKKACYRTSLLESVRFNQKNLQIIYFIGLPRRLHQFLRLRLRLRV